MAAPAVVPFIINGQDVETETKFDVTSPVSGKVIHRASAASVDDAKRAADAAYAAYPAWKKMKPSDRRDILLRAADIMQARQEELIRLQLEETGASRIFAQMTSMFGFTLIRDFAGRISSVEGRVPVVEEEGQSAIVYKEPYGVILGIAPWNAPFILGTRAVAIPLAAGNTVVLKGSELAPKCFWAIGDIFREAGLPAGCLNVVYHQASDAPAVTEALIAHPAIRKINFTGSTPVGSIIGSLAGKYIKPVLLELGGKAGALVLDDADLNKAALGCTMGAFIHAGQVCMSTERIIVQRSILDKFRQVLTETAEKVFGKDSPAPMLVNSIPVEKNRRLISDAVSKGAKVIWGDHEAREASEASMRPLIVENVTKEMDLFVTESFGPTVSLLVVDTDEEAIELANATDYGLTASVYTENLARGLKIAKQIESGAVHINSPTIHDEPVLPHGGVKSSGFGRFGGSSGLEEFMVTKSVTWID
ncbi:hypothetical protein DTO271G3_7075 [Paecilomyces variotii]|nr:hypothetical protein DTO271G3_7075 [Paecilomyces variotii]